MNAFADMDQEMANVRKFTGMNAAQVEQLNEDFQKIDTRTGREELNKLAQEAGRLGKTSQEDVLGFVKILPTKSMWLWTTSVMVLRLH